MLKSEYSLQIISQICEYSLQNISSEEIIRKTSSKYSHTTDKSDHQLRSASNWLGQIRNQARGTQTKPYREKMVIKKCMFSVAHYCALCSWEIAVATFMSYFHRKSSKKFASNYIGKPFTSLLGLNYYSVLFENLLLFLFFLHVKSAYSRYETNE